MSRRDGLATTTVGAGLVGGGGVLRHKATRSTAAGRPWYDPSVRRVVARGARKDKRLYAAGAALGVVGGAGMTAGLHETFRGRKVAKAKGFIEQGIEGNLEAVKAKGENLKHKTPLHARAAALGVSAAAGGLGSLGAHRVIDRVAPNTKARAALTAVAGVGAAAGSLGASNRVVSRVAPGYRVTPNGVTRGRKRPVKASSKAGRTIDATHRSVLSRQQIVPSDERFAKDLSRGKKRALIAASGSVPVVGDFAAARTAASFAPKSDRKRTAATQFAGSAGGSTVGTVGGAYAGAHLSRHAAVAQHAERVDTALTRAKESIPGYRKAQAAASRLRPLGASTGKSAQALRRATAPLGGKAKATAAVGSLVGGSVLGQVGGQSATTANFNRHDRIRGKVSKLQAPLTPTMSRTQEIHQLKRKRRAAGISATNAALGTAGVGILVASKGKGITAARKASLERGALGTAVASGGLGAIGGFQSASIARRDIKARERQLGVAKRDYRDEHGEDNLTSMLATKGDDYDRRVKGGRVVRRSAALPADRKWTPRPGRLRWGPNKAKPTKDWLKRQGFGRTDRKVPSTGYKGSGKAYGVQKRDHKRGAMTGAAIGGATLPAFGLLDVHQYPHMHPKYLSGGAARKAFMLTRAAGAGAVAGGAIGGAIGRRSRVAKGMPDQSALHIPTGLLKAKTYRASSIATRRTSGGMLVATRRRAAIG